MSSAAPWGNDTPQSRPAAAATPASSAQTPPPGASTPSVPSLADVVEKLCTAFASRLARPTVIGVVRRCRRELEILTGPTRLEAIDRLARRRLTALANARDAALNASPRRFGHPHGDAP